MTSPNMGGPELSTESDNNSSPNGRQVNTFHNNSDVDTANSSQHHTLGLAANQASPGDHSHDGRLSRQINLEDLNINAPNVTGSRGGNAALGSLISALAGLGLIVDGTTA